MKKIVMFLVCVSFLCAGDCPCIPQIQQTAESIRNDLVGQLNDEASALDTLAQIEKDKLDRLRQELSIASKELAQLKAKKQ